MTNRNFMIRTIMVWGLIAALAVTHAVPAAWAAPAPQTTTLRTTSENPETAARIKAGLEEKNQPPRSPSSQPPPKVLPKPAIKRLTLPKPQSSSVPALPLPTVPDQPLTPPEGPSQQAGLEEMLLFGTDGVRWTMRGGGYEFRAGQRIGLATVAQALEQGRRILYVGRDGRAGSDEVQRGVMEAAQRWGLDVVDVGLITTPTIQAIVARDPEACGAAIATASHNPAEDVGIKLLRENGEKTPPEWEKDVANRLLQARDPDAELSKILEERRVTPTRSTQGQVRDGAGAVNEEIARVVQAVRALVAYGPPQFTMVVDAANSPGAARMWKGILGHPELPPAFREKLLVINTGSAPGAKINDRVGAEWVEKGEYVEGSKKKPNPLPRGVEVVDSQVRVTLDDGTQRSFGFGDVIVLSNDGDADRSEAIVFTRHVNQYGQVHRLVDGDRQIILAALTLRKLLAASGIAIPIGVAQTVMADPAAQVYLRRLGMPFGVAAVGDKPVQALAKEKALTKLKAGAPEIWEYGEASGHRGTLILPDVRRQLEADARTTPVLGALLELENGFGDAIRNLLLVPFYLTTLGLNPSVVETETYSASAHQQIVVPLPRGRFTNSNPLGLVLVQGPTGELEQVGQMGPEANRVAASFLGRSDILKVVIRPSGTVDPTKPLVSIRVAEWMTKAGRPGEVTGAFERALKADAGVSAAGMEEAALERSGLEEGRLGDLVALDQVSVTGSPEVLQRLASAATVLLTLDAGKGTRFEQSWREAGRPGEPPLKVIAPLAGLPAGWWTKQAAETLGWPVISVVGYRKDDVIAAYNAQTRHGVIYVESKDPAGGTGYAFYHGAAVPGLKESDTLLIATAGDQPLFDRPVLEAMERAARTSGADLVIATALFADPTGKGRIVRDRQTGQILGSLEQRDIEKKGATLGGYTRDELLAIHEGNVSIYAMPTKRFFALLAETRNINAQRQFYVTDIIKMVLDAGGRVEAVQIPPEQAPDLTTVDDLAQVETYLRAHPPSGLEEMGVTPTRTFDASPSAITRPVVTTATISSGGPGTIVTVTTAPGAPARVFEVPSVVPVKKLVIASPEAVSLVLSVLRQLIRTADGHPVPIIAIVRDAAQAAQAQAGLEALGVPNDEAGRWVINLAVDGRPLQTVLADLSARYLSDGWNPLIIHDVSAGGLEELARFLGVPEAALAAFARAAESLAQQALERFYQ